MPSTTLKFTPKRGRPSAEQVAAIEHSILSSGRKLFVDEGFDAVTMERVAAVAGVSKGTLYARYPSKSALFTALVEATVRDLSNASAALDHLLTDDIGERLRHHARSIAKSLTLAEVKAFQRSLLANRDRFPELARALYDKGYRFTVALIAADIEAAARRDGIPVRNAESIGALLVSALTGWQQQEAGHHEPQYDELERAAMRTVDLLLAARTSW